MTPASAGPTARAPFTVTPPRAEDAPISSRGTSSGWIACHAGEVRVEVIPSRNVKPRIVHGVRSPRAAITVSTAAITALAAEPTIRSRRRSSESASTPAGSEKSIAGARLAVCTRAMTVGPAAASTRNHCAPTVCIQVPMLLPSCANHSTRNAVIAIGAHAETLRRAGRAGRHDGPQGLERRRSRRQSSPVMGVIRRRIHCRSRSTEVLATGRRRAWFRRSAARGSRPGGRGRPRTARGRRP